MVHSWPMTAVTSPMTLLLAVRLIVVAKEQVKCTRKGPVHPLRNLVVQALVAKLLLLGAL